MDEEDFLEEESSIGQEVEEDEIEDPEKVLYFSSIPPKFTPARLQTYFERLAPGMIGRVYLEKNKYTKSMKDRFKEGWLEIKKKKVAKQLVNMADNTPVGGKKRDPTSGVLWNIKYLSGFKWVHLVEQLDYEKTARMNKRMAVEVSQARRIAAHFEEQVEKGENLRKLEKKILKQGGNWEKFQRQITQKQTIKKKKKKSTPAKSKKDDLMKMIFAE